METGLLDIPKKLVPLLTEFNNYKYFLLKGGRGGGKSQTIARFLLTLAEKYQLRIVCGREIQVNIAESVHSIFSDLITNYKLAFDILANRIEHKKSGTNINFRGFREQGRFNIHGMEGVNIVWIDESQALTKPTLDELIPTIRKNNAKIIFSMNPHVIDDPVVELLKDREDCLTIDINYLENEYCPEILIREAEECKNKNTEDYEHIWMGRPLDKSEDSVYTYPEIAEAKINKHALRESYGHRIAGFDIARFGDDKCACVVIQQMGALHWEEIHTEEWSKKDLNHTTGRILTIINELRVNDAIIDEDGIGSGPLDTLRHGRGMDHVVGFKNPSIGYKDNKEYANNRTVNAYKLKRMLEDEQMKINNDPLGKELLTMKYTYDHQQRKILISKQMMRDKYKIKSPNMADALIMAVSLIGEVKQKQDIMYQNRPQYAKEDNLFEIAGVM